MHPSRRTCDSYCAATYRFMSPSIRNRELLEFRNDNKGNVGLMGLLIAFLFITLFFAFSTAFIYETGSDYVIDPLHSEISQQATEQGTSQGIRDTIDQAKTDYDNLVIPYDLFFLGGWISFFISTLLTAIKSREETTWGFFGMITFGLISFLFVLGIMDTISDWFIENFITNLLDFSLTSTPIINFYVTNFTIISFSWAVILILVNKLNFEELGDRINPERRGGFQE